MEIFGQIIVFALLLDGIVENVKWLWIDTHFNVSRLLTTVLGIVLAVAAHINLPGLVNLSFGHWIADSAVTGILCARGSNYLYDLIKRITGEKAE